MGRLLHRIGWLAATRKWLFLGGWLVVAVTVVLLVRVYGAETNDNIQLPGTDSQAATDLLASRFPPQQNGASPVVFTTSKGKVTDAANKQAIEESHAAIVQLPHVYSATDPFSQQGQADASGTARRLAAAVDDTTAAGRATTDGADAGADRGRR